MKLKGYLKKARLEKWAIGQFNFSTLDQLKAIVGVSQKTKSPVILGTSVGEATFFGMEEAALLVSFYKKKLKLPVFLNLDHGKDLKLIKKAIDLGYDMVHFDGSKMPFNQNVKNTKEVIKYAKKRGVLIEGEIGYISGKSSYHRKKIDLSKIEKSSPEEVLDFVLKTKVDLLALSIGNVHGVYAQSPVIDFELLKKVQSIKSYLVLHGASGILPRDIKKAISLGVAKINVNTDLRIAWKESLRRSLKEKEFAPYNLLQKSHQAVFNEVEKKIKLFKG